AEIVVTNSFHGVMLSLIFGRPFIAVPVEGKDMNARIQNVLRELGQTHRILSTADPERVEELVKEGLDKAAVNAGLERLRAGGMEFLRKNLLG
ncbi:MAG: polysaccharide pyruvyl transferase family protein, partial [Clostridia bacterium]|nr:polysaccharide pyruvyl transferase family protein [Clostridia bacterium]